MIRTTLADRTAVAVGILVLLLSGPVVQAQLLESNDRSPGQTRQVPKFSKDWREVRGAIGPDVIVGSLNGVSRLAGDGTYTAYSVGTTACNIGDEDLLWEGVPSSFHPVISQNMFRLKDGRFEHIGQAWLKHGFCAFQGFFCSTPENPCAGGGSCIDLLLPGCSDPYTTSNNGLQSGMGPKWQVNAHTGVFPINPTSPYWDQGEGIDDSLDRRLRVANVDLDPALNSGALYFVEGHYVTQDDPAAGNGNNNATYRRVAVGAAPDFNLTFMGATLQQQPAIQAWQDNDASVTLTDAAVPGEGLFVLGHTVTDNGDGTWTYEYALYNMNSHESAGRFSVPVGVGAVISNIGFHDVDYHSGDGEGGSNFDGTDWAAVTEGGLLTWSTASHLNDPSANALRWATLYNFRFDADQPPQAVNAIIGLYRSSGQTVLVASEGPQAACPECDDGSACTDDGCDVGAGCTHSAITCNDSKLCTSDSCDAVTGCVYDPLDCDDGDACTDDSCDPATGGCLHDAVDCDDGLLCTIDSCSMVSGCANVPVDCDDRNACTTDSCDPMTGMCEYDLVHCADGNFCTNDSCDTEIGCINAPVDCDDGDACTADSCNPASGCVHTPVDCDDSNLCTVDSCDVMDGCANDPVNCDDGDACTDDSCNPATGLCGHDPVDCDDADLCTTDGCSPAGGCSNTPVDCDDGLLCTTDTCNPATGACEHAPVNCDDGDLCTTDDCNPGTGACTHTPVNCDDGDPCTTDSCAAGTGACQHDPVVCDDGLFCNGLETCVGGNCQAGSDPCPGQTCNEDQDRCVAIIYDYSGIASPSSSHTAEDGEIDVGGDIIANGTFNARRDFIPGWANWAEATTQEYQNLVASDNLRYQTADPGGGDNAAMIFELYVEEDPVLIERIDVLAEISRGDSSLRGFVYLWNYRTSEYLVGASSPAQGDVVLTFSVTSDAGDYVRADGQLTVFVVNQDTSDWIRVDHIQVAIEAPPCDSNADCQDGTVCTTDTCNPDGTCNHELLDCDDGLICTADGCNAASGCTHTAVDCDDDDACTSESCNEIDGCVYVAVDCDDSNVCTIDTCEPASGCQYAPLNCSDGNACTADGCDPVNGCTHDVIVCDDGTVCTDDSCNPASGCVFDPIDCDDLDACTADSCDALIGCKYSTVDCDDQDACTIDGCDTLSGCTHDPVNCNDGNACTADGCDAASGCTNDAISCDDANACTTDGCDTLSGCTHVAVDCDDADACTADSCDPGNGCQHSPVNCDDGNGCTADSCDPVDGCAHQPLPGGTACEADGDLCTLDVCDGAGQCNFDANVSCPPGEQCADGVCQPPPGCGVAGDCCSAHPDRGCQDVPCCASVCAVLPDCCTDGWNAACATLALATCESCFECLTPADCIDGDACTVESCVDNRCVYTPLNCDDGNPCTDDCDPLIGCFHTPNEAPCNDGNPCTVQDACSGGTCTGGPPNDCDDDNACTADTCNAIIGCQHSPIHCADGNFCTDDSCDPASGCVNAPVDCDDGNPCTDDACDSGVGCVHPFNSDPCDDGDPCTSDDGCVDGSCAGQDISCEFGAECIDGVCAPPNDTCSEAIPLQFGEVTGTTTGASIDDTVPSPCQGFVTSPGVWYSVDGTGNMLTASTCGPYFGFDSKISIYTPDCGTPACVGGSSQSCTGGPSELLSTVSWCSVEGQKYLILVHGFAGETGPFSLTVTAGGECPVCEDDEDCGPGAECNDGQCESAPLCGQPGSGDCLQEGGNGSPGCEENSCCTAVCAQPQFEFCCQVEWDGGCASQAQLQCTVAEPCQATDLNFDGVVNAADLAILLGAWGPNPGHPADFNGDEVVNAADLAQLLGAWGPAQGCDDGDACTEDWCDVDSGTCVYEPVSCPGLTRCVKGRCLP